MNSANTSTTNRWTISNTTRNNYTSSPMKELETDPRPAHEQEHAQDQQAIISVPNVNDILMGRGEKTKQHSGNKRLRLMVLKNLKRFKQSAKKQKSQMIVELIQWVHKLNPPGRFLKQDPKHLQDKQHQWYEMSFDDARKKVSHLYRDTELKDRESKKAIRKDHKKDNTTTYLYSKGKPISSLNINDILLGRGEKTKTYSGNQQLRNMVMKNLERYKRSTRRQKSEMIIELVDWVGSLKPAGRFLEQRDKGQDQWYEMSFDDARKKVSHLYKDTVLKDRGGQTAADDTKSSINENHNVETDNRPHAKIRRLTEKHKAKEHCICQDKNDLESIDTNLLSSLNVHSSEPNSSKLSHPNFDTLVNEKPPQTPTEDVYEFVEHACCDNDQFNCSGQDYSHLFDDIVQLVGTGHYTRTMPLFDSEVDISRLSPTTNSSYPSVYSIEGAYDFESLDFTQHASSAKNMVGDANESQQILNGFQGSSKYFSSDATNHNAETDSKIDDTNNLECMHTMEHESSYYDLTFDTLLTDKRPQTPKTGFDQDDDTHIDKQWVFSERITPSFLT